MTVRSTRMYHGHISAARLIRAADPAGHLRITAVIILRVVAVIAEAEENFNLTQNRPARYCGRPLLYVDPGSGIAPDHS